jgi:hypothetical protein
VFRANDVGRRSREPQDIAVGSNAHLQPVFERREILVELSEETDAIFQTAQIDGSL